jgi:PAS domain S-box-containing protein
VRAQGGVFVEAVRATRVPMLVTDATLVNNPIVFANGAFLAMSGYTMEEVIGRDPHFMDGPRTAPAAIQRFKSAICAGRDETLDLLQYRKDRSTLSASVFVGPWRDRAGKIIHHFLSFLDITLRVAADTELRALTATLEARVAERTADLEAANARLTELLAERKLLLDEVNHRAKNSLMIASSLLSVQAGQQEGDSAVRVALEMAQSRLLAMARAHDLLSFADHPQQVVLADYIKAVCLSLEPTDDNSRVRIVVDVQGGIPIAADRAVSIGLLVNELVTNALKHAFPPPRVGAVEVQGRRLAPDRIGLTVRDDGIGMPAGRKDNLGFGIVRALTRQIGGELEVDAAAGTSVSIAFAA